MTDQIIIKGIETNNLKGIDLILEKKAVNLIIGPSGSGKSSLAYDTVAQIGQHELMAMYADDVAEPSYRVNGYQNMVAAVPIKQTNANNNLHSTIGTYFGLNRTVAFLYAVNLGLREDQFTLNKTANLCPCCHGLGYVNILDANRIIDYNTPLDHNPIRCWNRYKDFYSQIIKLFCDDQGIDSSKTFRQLTDDERQTILFGESDVKYSVRYKKLNAYSRRTTKYLGPMLQKPMLVGFAPSKQYYSDHECKCCHGQKYSPDCLQFQVHGLSIGEFMTLPFQNLTAVLKAFAKESKNAQTLFALKSLQRFVEKANELHLGHLCLHRAIPTLSGGELQRLKMVQVFNSQLTDLLIVLDEPLAGLSGYERDAVYRNIIELSKSHTVLVVDHSNAFYKVARTITALGPGGGMNGGQLIDVAEYIKSESVEHRLPVKSATGTLDVDVKSNVYMYKGASLSFCSGCMNLVTGPSGVGKTTLLREYLPQVFESYQYISQKPLNGNKNSHVVSALDVYGRIQDIFAHKTGKDRKLFSNLTGNDGACPCCGGAGFIEYGYDNRTRTLLVCADCEGTGFNKSIKKLMVKGASMFDIWNMTIDVAAEFFRDLDSKIAQVLDTASTIMLGHLQLGQTTASLSGGENIRIKIMKAAKSSASILGIDEPFRGLGASEIYKVSAFLNSLIERGKTIVVVDHSEISMKYFSKIITLENDSGTLMDAISKTRK